MREEVEDLATFDDDNYDLGDTSSNFDEVSSQEDDGTFTEISESEGEEGQDQKEIPSQTDRKEKINSDSQVNLLEEKESSREEKVEKKPDNPDEGNKDKSTEPEHDSKESPSEKVGEPSEEVRTIKAFKDGKKYEIPENAEIKVKVSGKNEKVSIQELRDAYSGKVAYDRKFTDIGERERTLSGKEESMTHEVGQLREHLGQVRQLTEKAMKGEVDPFSSMNYLLDLMGISTVDYSKAMYDHMAGEFDVYSELTESEREAHWTKKENAYLVKQQESLRSRRTEEVNQSEFSQHVHSLREAHSITQEDYVTAEEDLTAEGMEATPEQIVQAAQLRPLLDQADSLIGPYEDQLTDEEADALSVDIATTMLKSPEMSIDQVKRVLAEQFEVEDIMSTIVKKVGKVEEYQPSTKRGQKDIESFDDLF